MRHRLGERRRGLHQCGAAALCTAQAGESPLVLISGHAGVKEVGRGAFQELRQAEMAAPAAKASWVASAAEEAGPHVADAAHIAMSGRRGQVHLSLPFDLLEARVEEQPSLWPPASAFGGWQQDRARRRRARRWPASPRPSARSFSLVRSFAMAAILRCCCS